MARRALAEMIAMTSATGHTMRSSSPAGTRTRVIAVMPTAGMRLSMGSCRNSSGGEQEGRYFTRLDSRENKKAQTLTRPCRIRKQTTGTHYDDDALSHLLGRHDDQREQRYSRVEHRQAAFQISQQDMVCAMATDRRG